MANKPLPTLCDILINRINLIEYNRAKRGLSMRRFSKVLIKYIKRHQTEVQELLDDACEYLYGAPLKRRRLSSLEESDEGKSTSQETEEKSSNKCGEEKQNSNVSDHNSDPTRGPEVTSAEDIDNGDDKDNGEVITVLSPGPERKFRRLTIFSARKTLTASRLATTVAGKDRNSCCSSTVFVQKRDNATQVDRYINDHIPSAILLNSRQNIMQLDLLELKPTTVEDITKRLV